MVFSVKPIGVDANFSWKIGVGRALSNSKSYHALKIEEALNGLNVSESGLSQEEAQQRLTTYGPNELKKEKGKSPIKLFLSQFTDILMIILLIAMFLSLGLGIYENSIEEIYSTIIIFAIVIASAALGFTQEYRSEKAVATSTGMATEFGKIAQMVQSAPQEQTPLEKRMATVSTKD